MNITFRRPLIIPILAFGVPDEGFATARVTSPFGPRDGVIHTGIDIGNGRLGDVVVAAASGVVKAVGNLRAPWSQVSTRWPSGNFGGLMIVIEHGPNVYSVYCHLRRAVVTTNQRVVAGQGIGEIGETGSALTGGGHLHFEIVTPTASDLQMVLIPRDKYRDPWPYITGRATISIGEDMPTRLPGAAYKMYGDGERLPAFKTKPGARLRSFPSTITGDVVHEFEGGIGIRPYARIDASAFEGGVANGSPDWLEVRAYTGAGYEYGFLHSSAVEVVALPLTSAEMKIQQIRGILA